MASGNSTNKPDDSGLSPRAALAALAAIFALMVAFAVFVDSQLPTADARVCFPAKDWNTVPAQRPCARIVRVAEDGSLALRVEDASGRVRWRASVGARDR